MRAGERPVHFANTSGPFVALPDLAARAGIGLTTLTRHLRARGLTRKVQRDGGGPWCLAVTQEEAEGYLRDLRAERARNAELRLRGSGLAPPIQLYADVSPEAVVRHPRPPRWGLCNVAHYPALRPGGGYIYLVQPDPERRPERVKLGWTRGLRARVAAHFTVCPEMQLLRLWLAESKAVEAEALRVA